MGVTQFPKLNLWAMLKDLLNNNVAILSNAGVPTNGTSGSFAGYAGPGTLVLDYTNGALYINAGTKASPIWANTGGAVSGDGGLGSVGNAKMTYDFAVDGGAIGLIAPANTPLIPVNSIILGGTIDITTQLTSGGAATIALGLGAAGQAAALKAATAVASWTVGQLALIPVFTAATYVKLTGTVAPTLTVAAFALTAGKFDVNLVYVRGN